MAPQNKVTLSYRSATFSRLKPKITAAIKLAVANSLVTILFDTNVISIHDTEVILAHNSKDESIVLSNDLVYIFAGGELPTQFLKDTGIEITKRFGYTVKSH